MSSAGAIGFTPHAGAKSTLSSKGGAASAILVSAHYGFPHYAAFTVLLPRWPVPQLC
jgi:hypothetical protein